MLAEKFFLVLETIISAPPHGSSIVVSTSRHVPTSCRARASSLRVRSTMPLGHRPHVIGAARFRDARHQGHSSAMVSQSHLSAATGAMLEKRVHGI